MDEWMRRSPAATFDLHGLTVLEVTLRTPAALEVIAEMKTVAGAIVGAGTVLNEADRRSRGHGVPKPVRARRIVRIRPQNDELGSRIRGPRLRHAGRDLG